MFEGCFSLLLQDQNNHYFLFIRDIIQWVEHIFCCLLRYIDQYFKKNMGFWMNWVFTVARGFDGFV